MNILSDVRRVLSCTLLTTLALNKKTDRKTDVLILITAVLNLVLCIMNIKELCADKE